jgi:hypothetical protein
VNPSRRVENGMGAAESKVFKRRYSAMKALG